VRRSALALTAIGLVAALIVPAALGAGYGRGRFVGTAKPESGSGGPSPVVIKVKGHRARVVEMTYRFDCADDGSVLTRTLSTPFVHVKNGPAGGGAHFDGKVTTKEGESVDLTVFLGLRERSVNGISSATMDVQGLPCFKDLIFKANKK
jgi:hypothetical protein